jgi:hypothetical protein
VPALNLGAQPEHRSSAAEFDHGARHIRIADLVLADCVAVRQAEDLCNVVSVDEVIDENAAGHEKSLHR